MKLNTSNMLNTLFVNHPSDDKWLYEIRQKGEDRTCYVMVPNANVCISINYSDFFCIWKKGFLQNLLLVIMLIYFFNSVERIKYFKKIFVSILLV